MNKDIKERWVKALRSGEVNGQKVEQVDGVLRKEGEDGTIGLCCLAVLCVLALEDGVSLKREVRGYETIPTWKYKLNADDFTWHQQEDEDLPVVVMEWAGLTDSNPTLKDSKGMTHMASIWNDDQDASFADIADMVENTL